MGSSGCACFADRGCFSGVFLEMDDLKKSIGFSEREKAVPTGTNDYDSTADFQSKAVIFYIWPDCGQPTRFSENRPAPLSLVFFLFFCIRIKYLANLKKYAAVYIPSTVVMCRPWAPAALQKAIPVSRHGLKCFYQESLVSALREAFRGLPGLCERLTAL